MNVAAIIQARMGSSRFPGKSMERIGGRPILWYLFEQLKGCRQLEHIVLATTESKKDDALTSYAQEQGWHVFRGSEADVLDRYARAASYVGLKPEDGIVRLTGDDILPDPDLIDAVSLVYRALAGKIDYVSTNRSGSLPYGAGVELCSMRSLLAAQREALAPREREHVTPYIREHPELFVSLDMSTSRSFNSIHLSIDYPEDLDRNARLIETMSSWTKPPYRLRDLFRAIEKLGLVTEKI